MKGRKQNGPELEDSPRALPHLQLLQLGARDVRDSKTQLHDHCRRQHPRPQRARLLHKPPDLREYAAFTHKMWVLVWRSHQRARGQTWRVGSV